MPQPSISDPALSQKYPTLRVTHNELSNIQQPGNLDKPDLLDSKIEASISEWDGDMDARVERAAQILDK